MADHAATAVLILVIGLLFASCLQQFRQLGTLGGWLDRLAILPQWRFFGQRAVDAKADIFADHHLIARLASGSKAAPGPWQSVLAPRDTHPFMAVWNPRLRSEGEYFMAMAQLADPTSGQPVPPTALSYLTLLRLALRHMPPATDQQLQFAVVSTLGRQHRAVAVRFVSDWHRP
jgi:hypothetical protein